MKAYLLKEHPPGYAEVVKIDRENNTVEVKQGVYGITCHSLGDVVLKEIKRRKNELAI